MIPQRLDFGPADGRVLTPAGDQDTSVPRPAAHPALKLQQIASLRLRQGRAPMDAQLGHEEPDLAQLAHDENRSEEHTSELQSLAYLVCRLLLEKKKTKRTQQT